MKDIINSILLQESCGTVVPALLLLPHLKALPVKHSLCFFFLWVAEDRDRGLHFRGLVKLLDNIVNGFFSTTRAAVSPMDELRNTQTLQNEETTLQVNTQHFKKSNQISGTAKLLSALFPTLCP